MTDEVRAEVEGMINSYELKCSVEEFLKSAAWEGVFDKHKLSEDFIRYFVSNTIVRNGVESNFLWNRISLKQTLSEKFIREFRDQVSWINLSSSQTLSMPFITEFKDKVCWHNISIRQELSQSFISRHQDKLDIDRLISRGLITAQDLEPHKANYLDDSRLGILDL